MRFDPAVLGPDAGRRGEILTWLEAALTAVDPVRLTRAAIAAHATGPIATIAIGKAAPAMSRGAAEAASIESGLCVTDHVEPVPEGISVVIGDHPLPGERSYRAGEQALEFVASIPRGIDLIGLISGGGSALCESPRPGIGNEYLTMVNERMLRSNAAIDEINLVRRHLSMVKGGGLAAHAGRPIETFVVSDVAGADPTIVASGPTVPSSHDAESARASLRRRNIEVGPEVWEAMQMEFGGPESNVTLLADGFDAAQGVAKIVAGQVQIRSEWLQADIEECTEELLALAGPGVTVAVGEPLLDVRGPGLGGRNTHAALLVARAIRGSESVFVAFATDGVDGCSGSAGAIVDGGTVDRGGDPVRPLSQFDSASYLHRAHDLLRCAPTGTNVSDLWILWNPG